MRIASCTLEASSTRRLDVIWPGSRLPPLSFSNVLQKRQSLSSRLSLHPMHPLVSEQVRSAAVRISVPALEIAAVLQA